MAAARERTKVAQEVQAERLAQEAAEEQSERDRPRTQVEQIAERAAAKAARQEQSRDRGWSSREMFHAQQRTETGAIES